MVIVTNGKEVSKPALNQTVDETVPVLEGVE